MRARPTDSSKKEFFLVWTAKEDQRSHQKKFKSREDAVLYHNILKDEMDEVRLITRTISVTHQVEVDFSRKASTVGVQRAPNGTPLCSEVKDLAPSGWCDACIYDNGTCVGSEQWKRKWH